MEPKISKNIYYSVLAQYKIESTAIIQISLPAYQSWQRVDLANLYIGAICTFQNISW